MAGDRWIQKASDRMKKRGTKGAFGRATKSKIQAGLRKGGLEAKRANFARNMKRIAAKRKGSSRG